MNTSTTATPTASASASGSQDPADVATAHQVVLQTSKGDIALNLFPEDAPMTVKNFVTLGKRGYYNNVVFHRIIQNFMIQSGDPTGTGAGGQSIYGAKFKDEINSHKIVKGTIAMANSGPNTNGSQFFIVTQSAQPGLDGSYTVFGQVADAASQTTVDAIAATPVTRSDSGESSKPTETVKITGFAVKQP